jgi:hypothetical protein
VVSDYIGHNTEKIRESLPMARGRSFLTYIADRFYNEIFKRVQAYTEDSDASALGLYSRSVSDFNEVELVDFEAKTVSVGDLPEMAIAFDLVIDAEFAVKEVTRHYDNDDTCHQWFKPGCKGGLNKDLDDFEIASVEIYDRKSAQANPLSDELVPII